MIDSQRMLDEVCEQLEEMVSDRCNICIHYGNDNECIGCKYENLKTKEQWKNHFKEEGCKWGD